MDSLFLTPGLLHPLPPEGALFYRLVTRRRQEDDDSRLIASGCHIMWASVRCSASAFWTRMGGYGTHLLRVVYMALCTKV